MNEREKYIADLASYLSPLSAADRQDALEFYDEYIADGGLESREAIEQQLGSPRQLSRQILADYSIKANAAASQDGRPASTQSSWKVFWLVVAAIVTSPFTLGVGLLIAIGLVVVAAIVFGIMVTALALVVALAVTAVMTLYVGIGLLAQAPMVGIFYVGIGLATIGAFMVCLPLMVWLIRWLAQAIANLAQSIYRKLKNHRKEAA